MQDLLSFKRVDFISFGDRIRTLNHRVHRVIIWGYSVVFFTAEFPKISPYKYFLPKGDMQHIPFHYMKI